MPCHLMFKLIKQRYVALAVATDSGNEIVTFDRWKICQLLNISPAEYREYFKQTQEKGEVRI